MKTAFKYAAVAAFAVALFAGQAIAQDVDAKTRKLPGYVDFKAMKMFKGQEARVEVFLKEPMLKLVNQFVRKEDPELHDVLGKLKLVRVQVFDIDPDMIAQFTEVTNNVSGELDKKGWERIVRVRDDDDNVDVYLLPSENYESILGIVVMAAEDEQAVFVNIVGEIRPEDVSRLGEHFDINELEIDDVHLDKNKDQNKRKR